MGRAGTELLGDFAVTDDAIYVVYLSGERGATEVGAQKGPGAWPVVLSKVGLDGEVLWLHDLPGQAYTFPPHVAVGADGSVYVAASFDASADFDPGDADDTRDPGQLGEYYVAAFDSDGKYRFTKTYPPTFHVGSNGELLVRTDGDAVYLYGEIRPSDAPLAGEVLRLDSDGNEIWTRAADTGGSAQLVARGGRVAWGTAGAVSLFDEATSAERTLLWSYSQDGEFRLRALALDDEGAVYVAGIAALANEITPLDLDPGPPTANAFSVGSYDAFVLKVGADGNYAWGRTVGGIGADAASSLAIAPDGSLVVAGSFRRTVAWGLGSSFDQRLASGVDAFALELAPDGSTVGVYTFGGEADDEGPLARFGPDGSLFLGGVFEGQLNLDVSCSGNTLASAGEADAYLARLTPATRRAALPTACGDEPVEPPRNETDPRLAGTSLPQNFDDCVAAGGTTARAITGYLVCRFTVNLNVPSFSDCKDVGGSVTVIDSPTSPGETCTLRYAEYGPLCLGAVCP